MDTNGPTRALPQTNITLGWIHTDTQAPAYRETLGYSRRTQLQTRSRTPRCGASPSFWVLVHRGTPPYPQTHETPQWLSLGPARPPLPPRRPPPSPPLPSPPPPKDVQNTPQNKPRLPAPPSPPRGGRSPIHFRPSPGKSLPPRSPASAAPRPETAAHLDFPLHSLAASLPVPTAAN